MLERFNQRAANTVISANIAKELVVSLLEGKEHEVFMVLFLNNQHHLIEAEEMFRGTINGSAYTEGKY